MGEVGGQIAKALEPSNLTLEEIDALRKAGWVYSGVGGLAEGGEGQVREALRGVSNAYGCFAGCTGGLRGAPPDGSGHTPACVAARAALSALDGEGRQGTDEGYEAPAGSRGDCVPSLDVDFLSRRVRELEGALCAIETRLVAADGVSLAQGHAAALGARELATAALGPKPAGTGPEASSTETDVAVSKGETDE